MAIDSAALTEAEITLSGDPSNARVYSAVVVFDGTSYVALCPELDIASVGDSSQEAVISVKAAVREALATAAEAGVEAGEPVSDADLAEFMHHHANPSVPVYGSQFTI